MWKLANTWAAPTSGSSMQRGFPAPGAGAQYTGAGPGHGSQHVTREPVMPSKGTRTFFQAAGPRAGQQGFPPPEAPAQMRPPGSMPNRPPVYGLPMPVWTPEFSRGAQAWVNLFGKVFTNPIGGGVPVIARPQASYGESGQYANGAIWWAPQVIPTSIPLIGLNDPAALEAIVGSLNVQAMVRTTG